MITPEIMAVLAVLVAAGGVVFALRKQTTTDTAHDIGDLQRNLTQSQQQIQWLLEQVGEMKREIIRLQDKLLFQENENRVLRGQIEQYQHRLSQMGIDK